jgi:DNA-binding response OmpR family regulator
MRLLLIEDDPYISDVIQRGLSNRGMTVEIAADGLAGLALAEGGNYDLILLDVKLPKLDGISVCRTLRARGFSTPVLMLTALGDPNNMEAAFTSGADDYLTKPFDFNTLIAHIRTLARIDGEELSMILAAGDLVVDLMRRTVTRGGQRINVSDMEFALLECLLRHRGEVVSGETLRQALGNIRFDPRSTLIDTLIANLSRTLGPPGCPVLFEAVGTGYRFTPK